MMRVLKPSGSMFIDLGDKYQATSFDPAQRGKDTPGVKRPTVLISCERCGAEFEGGPGRRFCSSYCGGSDNSRRDGRQPIRNKSLMLLPERYRIGCVDRLGLIARAVIVWDKPNGLPESVTDRVRRSHEDWVHLVRQPRYYSALDEVREPHAGPPHAPGSRCGGNIVPNNTVPGYMRQPDHIWGHPLGKLPGSVWNIPSEPLRLPEHLGVQHYAAFPSEWPRRLILGFSPPGICVDCGQGRVPVVEREAVPPKRRTGGGPRGNLGKAMKGDQSGMVDRHDRPGFDWASTILGYACSCTPYTDHPGSGEGGVANRTGPMGAVDPGNSPPSSLRVGNDPKVGPWREYHLDGWTPPPTRSAVVLDCFGGTGTTAMVAKVLGRIGVSVDLSHAYGRAARWRVKHDGAKAISRTNLERQQVLL